MKKTVLIVVAALALWAQSTSVYMGQTYYAYFLSQQLGEGSEFTKRHNARKWEELFARNAKGFYEKYDIEKELFDTEQLRHLEAFMKYYAKDKKKRATCN